MTDRTFVVECGDCGEAVLFTSTPMGRPEYRYTVMCECDAKAFVTDCVASNNLVDDGIWGEYDELTRQPVVCTGCEECVRLVETPYAPTEYVLECGCEIPRLDVSACLAICEYVLFGRRWSNMDAGGNPNLGS